MQGRAELLHIVDEVYAARIRGDKAALNAYWAPGAIYRMVGEGSMLPSVPVGPADATEAVDSLVDMFEFHEMERLNALVEDNRASIHWRLVVSKRGGAPVTTEMHDIWEFDADGKARSLIQFIDTALVTSMLE